ncbi:MAG: hypothetical protein AB7L84_15755 [Acidimicrobiia bacterium]
MAKNDDSTPDAPTGLHRRLSVVPAGQVERVELVRRRARDGEGRVIDLTSSGTGPVDPARLRHAARQVAAVKADERRAELERLKAHLQEALAGRQAAIERRDAAARRVAQLCEGADWCGSIEQALPTRLADIEAARSELEARQAEQRAASHRLAQLLDQQSKVAAAREEAERELQVLEGVHLDESSVRRQVEAANVAARDAVAAQAEAQLQLEWAEARCADLGARIDGVLAERFAVEATLNQPLGDVTVVQRALDRFEDAATFAHRDQRAEHLVEAIRAVQADLAVELSTRPPGPSPAELEAARVEMVTAMAELTEAEATAQAAALTAEQRAEVDRLHDAVLEAQATGSSGRKRLEAAMAAEAEHLESLGFTAYLEVILTGGRPPGASEARARAEHEAKLATDRHLALVEAATVSPNLERLLAERDRLVDEAARMLRVDPADRILELLEGFRAVPFELVDDLAAALEGVGVRPVGQRLEDAAGAWLGAQEALAESRRDGLARLGGIDEQRAQLAAELAQAQVELARRAEELQHAVEAETSARRTVLALEGELVARAGEDDRRLKRVAAAEQLRSQVEAVERALAASQVEVTTAVDAATSLATAAEAGLERAEAELAEVRRRVHDLVALLPPPLALDVEADALERIDRLGEGLREVKESGDAELAAAEQGVADADDAVDAASSAVNAARLAVSGEPTGDDLVAALGQLLGADVGTGPVLVDDPTVGQPAEARQRLLEVVLQASAEGPVVLLTDDPEILGWAIALPSSMGAVVPVDVLVGHLGAVPDPEPADRRAAPADVGSSGPGPG